MTDSLAFYEQTIGSRLISGTALFPSPTTLADSVRASGAEIVTVSLRRESGPGEPARDFGR